MLTVRFSGGATSGKSPNFTLQFIVYKVDAHGRVNTLFTELVNTGQGFSAVVVFWGWIILCCGGRPVHGRVFNSLPGLYPLDGSSTPHPQL